MNTKQDKLAQLTQIVVFVNTALYCPKNAQLVYIINVDLHLFLHWAESAGVYEHS
jgi:hypothetical protein